MSFQRLTKAPWAIAMVTLALRLAAMQYMHAYEFPFGEDVIGLRGEIGRVAKSIAEGHGFANPFYEPSGPTAFVPPLYTYLVAGAFKVFGPWTRRSAAVVLMLNSLFSALTCLVLYALAKRTLGQDVATLTAWGWALLPYAVFFSTKYVWESCLSALLVSLAVLLAFDLAQRPTSALWAVSGLLWGGLALTNTAALAALPFLLLWIGWHTRSPRRHFLASAGLAMLVTLVCVAPWIARNYAVFHHFIFVRDNFWLEVSLGNRAEALTAEPGGQPVVSVHPGRNPAELRRLAAVGEWAYMQECKQRALRFIREHPASFAWLTLRRFVAFWKGTQAVQDIFLLSGRFAFAKSAAYALFSLAAFLGLFLTFGNSRTNAWLFSIPLGIFPLVYYIAHIAPHYRHPIEPIMTLLATYALFHVFKHAMHPAA